jgi:hypothetical protein
MRDDPTKIMQNMKNVTMVDLNGGTEKLTQNVYKVRNVRPSDSKVNKALYNVTITSGILKRLNIRGCKVNIELHESQQSGDQ